jgi:phosphoenolpyruvate carboxylase
MTAAPDPHQPLREDVSMLGGMLGDSLRAREGDAVYEMVERIRRIAKDARLRGGPAVPELAPTLRELPLEMAVPVARAFSHFLALANIAEQHHRVRRRRDYERAHTGTPQPGSFEDVLTRLAGGEADLHASVCALRIALVLTAHPTAITRPTLAAAHARIAAALGRQDRRDLNPFERDEVAEDLRREIDVLWGSDEVRRRRPTPMDEVRGGLYIFEQTLWDALPRCVRALDRVLARLTGRGLPLDAAPIVFGSWIGGDRDGNPAITAAVTREACEAARAAAARLYAREIDTLAGEVPVTAATADLRDAASGAREPYRAVLQALASRVREAGATLDAADLRATLELCHRSLRATGQTAIANGRLTDLLRRVAAFGASLVRLDIRQHSARHEEVLEAITGRLGLGSYVRWDEAARQAFLIRAIRDRIAVPADLGAGPDVAEVLATFRAIGGIPEDSLGAYVVSMTRAPSDILAVEYLQSAHGSSLRVVPLFEEVATLEHAGETMRAIWTVRTGAASEPRERSEPAKRRARERVGESEGRSPSADQEVMIGYSDSAKDGGRLAANWQLYKAQENVVASARDAGMAVTIFHGRGGSIGRGGGPTHLALQSQPPGSIDGRLRVTVQGEMIDAQFGLPDIAVRTLEVYVTSVLDATLAPRTPVQPEWRETMERLADEAHAVYRQIVYDDPRFLEYFRTATPEREIGLAPIGSRPAKRGGDGGVESLRAIPWVFAWTQTRLLLPSWLGTGEALDAAARRGERDAIRRMARDWPFFGATLQLIEMALAEAEPGIVEAYDRALVPESLRDVGVDLRARLDRARRQVLDALDHGVLLEDNPVLRRSIDVRNPYVDPINLVQIALLAHLRGDAVVTDDLWQAFLITVNGIAAGMRNVG